ncbi:hypothetical protein [Pandoraea sp.]|uniref:hypothetical protein n=1 Tax=Pandoraea sp. TaxID=1883445 RepID=UPI00121F10B2|nr:hypothetical protein [Pandoraea sp.]TAL55123.1 MAG: hypothetical protein EPN80_08580 [Pandoraea sp.]
MTELQSFEADLAALIGEATNLRPFVCDGNPLLCDVFIVGANPASEMATGFWDFWDTATGFNKAQWCVFR